MAIADGGGSVWLVGRDEAVLDWFRIVRIADMQGLRWVLGAMNGTGAPVSVRRAQSWCTRMQTLGLLDRTRLGGPGGALVWATAAWTGCRPPQLLSQTTRHEVAVAAASGRYLAAGYGWSRDEPTFSPGSHQADGIAYADEMPVELVEVELTGKRLPRYERIFTAFHQRLLRRDATRVRYLCNAEAARAVRFALARLPIGQTVADRVDVREVFDLRGYWRSDEPPVWLSPAGVTGYPYRAVTSGGRVP